MGKEGKTWHSGSGGEAEGALSELHPWPEKDAVADRDSGGTPAGGTEGA